MLQILRHLFKSEQQLIEDYLSKSTSLQDLERRQQELFRNHRFL